MNLNLNLNLEFKLYGKKYILAQELRTFRIHQPCAVPEHRGCNPSHFSPENMTI